MSAGSGFQVKGWCPGILRPMESGDGLDLLPDDEAPRLLGVEHYRRAEVGARGEAFIERLGRGVGK